MHIFFSGIDSSDAFDVVQRWQGDTGKKGIEDTSGCGVPLLLQLQLDQLSFCIPTCEVEKDHPPTPNPRGRCVDHGPKVKPQIA